MFDYVTEIKQEKPHVKVITCMNNLPVFYAFVHRGRYRHQDYKH